MTDISLPSALRLAEDALEVAAKATPGPWSTISHFPNMIDLCGDGGSIACVSRFVSGEPGGSDKSIADAAFIAHARTSLPQLAEIVKQLAAEVERLRGLVGNVRYLPVEALGRSRDWQYGWLACASYVNNHRLDAADARGEEAK